MKKSTAGEYGKNDIGSAIEHMKPLAEAMEKAGWEDHRICLVLNCIVVSELLDRLHHGGPPGTDFAELLSHMCIVHKSIPAMEMVIAMTKFARFSKNTINEAAALIGTKAASGSELDSNKSFDEIIDEFERLLETAKAEHV